MKFQELTIWDYTESLEGLLFFAQLVDEMLFDHTLDSYKVPAMNTRLLCEELDSTLTDVYHENIREGAIGPIVEELVQSIGNDPIAKKLIGERYIIFQNELSNNNIPFEKINELVEALKECFKDNKYSSEAQKQLKEAISKPNEKSMINRITRLFLTEKINSGYHQSTIYGNANYIFFKNKKNRITNIDYVEKFFECFSNVVYEFNIIYIVPKLFKEFKQIYNKYDIEIEDNIESESHKRDEEKFYETKKGDDIFLICKKIKAFDHMTAYQSAESILTTLNNLYSYFKHTNKPKKSTECVSRRINSTDVLVINEPKNPILKLYTRKQTEKSAIQSLNDTLKKIKLESHSFYRFSRAIDLHAMALEANAIENQLLDLWAAIETLIPTNTKINKNRIDQLSDVVVPILQNIYIKNLLDDIRQDILQCAFLDFKDTISNITCGNDELQKVAAFIALSKYEDLRIESYSKLEKFPLLKNRIYYLHENLINPGKISSLLHHHNRRINWHIMRIYRTRNEIIHSGYSPPFLNSLVENLHSYLDIILHCCPIE
ncbi:MAG: hypothetical protein JXI43_11630 [Tissierellales bacterium]|nr:hypothetical protein [Tissierellales bacterium]